MAKIKPVTIQIFRTIKYLDAPLLKIIPNPPGTNEGTREGVRDMILTGLLAAYQAGAVSESSFNQLSIFLDKVSGPCACGGKCREQVVL